jgi:hypothetical protein
MMARRTGGADGIKMRRSQRHTLGLPQIKGDIFHGRAS